MVVTTAVFVRALGLVYLVAFLSLRVQVLGLFGSDGILPIAEYLDRRRASASAPSALVGAADRRSGSTPATRRCSASATPASCSALAVVGRARARARACSRSGRSTSRS